MKMERRGNVSDFKFLHVSRAISSGLISLSYNNNDLLLLLYYLLLLNCGFHNDAPTPFSYKSLSTWYSGFHSVLSELPSKVTWTRCLP